MLAPFRIVKMKSVVPGNRMAGFRTFGSKHLLWDSGCHTRPKKGLPVWCVLVCKLVLHVGE